MSARITASVDYRQAVAARVKARLKEKGKALREQRVAIGLPEEAGTTAKTGYRGAPAGASIIDVMAMHEYGLGVPERSWFRSWFDANANRLKLEATAAKREEYRGADGAIESLAIQWALELRQWVTEDGAHLKPLASATRDARRRAGLDEGPPLYATGQFVEAIRALVDGVDVGP